MGLACRALADRGDLPQLAWMYDHAGPDRSAAWRTWRGATLLLSTGGVRHVCQSSHLSILSARAVARCVRLAGGAHEVGPLPAPPGGWGRGGGGPPAALSSPDMGSETGRAISPTPGNRPSSSCGLAAASAAILEGANPHTHRHTRPEGRCESSGPERIV